MSLIAVAADRDPPAAPAKLADGAHQATLQRAFGRIFAVFMALHPPAGDTPCCWSCTSGAAIATTPLSAGPPPNAAP